jgi:antitoxin YefM
VPAAPLRRPARASSSRPGLRIFANGIAVARRSSRCSTRLASADQPTTFSVEGSSPAASVVAATVPSGWRRTGLTSSRRCATIVSMSTEPLRSVRDHLSEFVDRVEREHDRVMITRNGRDAAVLISAEDLAEMEETLSVLSDPEALADIREADEAYRRGDVVRGVDAVRQLRS